MGLERSVGQLETHAADMREFHGDITRMLRTPQERGEFGEQQLDVILNEHLPPSMYGLREEVVDGRTPDAHIESSAGLIPIDSKFPLENYERYVQADDADERTSYRRAFAKDVERQLETIADNYVRPSEGTTEFAFAFIPSESVYYHLVREEYDLLRGYTKQGVQVVSPLTLGHKLELIKADVQARQLSERAEAVLEQPRCSASGSTRSTTSGTPSITTCGTRRTRRTTSTPFTTACVRRSTASSSKSRGRRVGLSVRRELTADDATLLGPPIKSSRHVGPVCPRKFSSSPSSLRTEQRSRHTSGPTGSPPATR